MAAFLSELRETFQAHNEPGQVLESLKESNIDSVMGVPIGPLEKKIELHPAIMGPSHQVSEETMMMHLRVVFETPVQDVLEIERYPQMVPQIQFLGYTHDLWIPCAVCQQPLHLESLLEKLGKVEMFKMRNDFVKRLKRHLYMVGTGGTDCVFCVNPQFIDGVGLPMSGDLRDFPDYRDNFANVRQCQTCSKIWCHDCHGEYFDEGSKDDEVPHSGRTCDVLRAIRAGDDPSEAYLRQLCVACPSCNVLFQKAPGGCNNIKCRQCRARFCFRCLTVNAGWGHECVAKENYVAI